MFVRSIPSLVAALVAAACVMAAGPVAAQSNWVSPDGKVTMSLPADYIPLGAGGSAAINHFSVMRDGTRVATCSTSTEADQDAATPEIWNIVITEELNSPADHARTAATNGGHGFVRYLGNRNFTSPKGFAGYLFWYERTNKTSGQTQTAVSSGTLLDGFTRQIGLCTSATGVTMTSAEIDTAGRFLTSARLR